MAVYFENVEYNNSIYRDNKDGFFYYNANLYGFLNPVIIGSQIVTGTNNVSLRNYLDLYFTKGSTKLQIEPFSPSSTTNSTLADSILYAINNGFDEPIIINNELSYSSVKIYSDKTTYIIPCILNGDYQVLNINSISNQQYGIEISYNIKSITYDVDFNSIIGALTNAFEQVDFVIPIVDDDTSSEPIIVIRDSLLIIIDIIKAPIIVVLDFIYIFGGINT